MSPRHPDVLVTLTGTDGNIFAVVGTVSRALRRAGVDLEERRTFHDEIATSHSYDAALRVVMAWVDVE